MRMRWFHFIGWLWLSGSATATDVPGGLTVTISPEEVRPGDLVTLQVRMDREEYGEFDLDVPSHPQLHLVSRERIPVRLVDGRHRQGERLVLQAISSGPLMLEGMTAQLTEDGGVRTVKLPELRIEVLSFDSQDENPAPEPLPGPAHRKNGQFPFAVVALGIVIGGLLAILIFLLIRNRRRREGDG